MDFSLEKIKKAVIAKKNSLKDTVKETQRVLKITEKPDKEEFTMAAKVTGAGIIFIGFIGFAFHMVANVIPMFI